MENKTRQNKKTTGARELKRKAAGRRQYTGVYMCTLLFLERNRSHQLQWLPVGTRPCVPSPAPCWRLAEAMVAGPHERSDSPYLPVSHLQRPPICPGCLLDPKCRAAPVPGASAQLAGHRLSGGLFWKGLLFCSQESPWDQVLVLSAVASVTPLCMAASSPTSPHCSPGHLPIHSLYLNPSPSFWRGENQMKIYTCHLVYPFL